MTGPEHYREAERLLAEQVRLDQELTDKLMTRDQMDASNRTLNRLVAMAQAHATLAVADNVAGIIDTIRSGGGVP